MNLNQRQKAAQAQVERIHRRNELIAKVDLLKIRIPIAKYATARREYRTVRARRNEAKQRTQTLQETHLPLKQRTDGYEAREKAAKRDVERKKKAFDDHIKKIKKMEDKTTEFDKAAAELRVTVSEIKKKRNLWKNKINSIKADIPKLERSLTMCQKNVDAVSPNLKDELDVTPPLRIFAADIGSNQTTWHRKSCNSTRNYRN